MNPSSQSIKTVELLERAIKIALDGHKGMKDKAGNPYILHPLRVMLSLDTSVEKIVGVLHDVVEDTKYTFEDLKKDGFSEEILSALDCVTKRESEDYAGFISRVKTNKIAIKVKIADLEDNMDIRRLKDISDKDTERLKKYLKYYNMLINEI